MHRIFVDGVNWCAHILVLLENWLTKETDKHMWWAFPALEIEEPWVEPDPVNGAKCIRELYELARRNYTRKYMVLVCYQHEAQDHEV